MAEEPLFSKRSAYMSQVASEPTKDPFLSGIRSDLPLLAARAALELDNQLLKKPVSFENVRLLAKRLHESTNASPGGADPKFIANPATSDVIIRAIEALQPQMRSIQEAATEAWRIAESLHSVEQTQCSP